MKQLSWFILLFSSLGFASAHLPDKIAGENLVDLKEIHRDFKSLQKTTVLVFLSAKCPCSASHEGLLSQMAKDFPEVEFVGIHSNADEPKELSQQHFAAANLSFPIIQDKSGKLADELGAYKTPHVFVFNSQGQLLYSGGVTDSHVGPTAKTAFLKQALLEIRQGKTPTTKEGRTLGCVISRDTPDKTESLWK